MAPHLTAPPDFILAGIASEEAQEAAARHAAWVAAYERARDLDRRRREAQARVHGLRERRNAQARQDAAAGLEDSREYAKLTTELQKAEDALSKEPWAERQAGVFQAVNNAKAAYESHLDAHRDHFIAEIEAQAVNVREALLESVDAVNGALGNYRAARDGLLALLPRDLRGQRGVVLPDDGLWHAWRQAEPHLSDPPAIEIVTGWRNYMDASKAKAAA